MSDGKSKLNSTNVLLLKISKRLTSEDLRDMKYLCSGHIAEGTLEKITTVIGLFQQIPQLIDTEDHGKSFISELLKHIGREDLSNELLGVSNDEQKPQQQNEEMKCFLQVEKMVAADWKRLGRHLGLEGYILEEIDADKKNVREKCACVLDKWKKLYGANIETLKEKLLEMGRRDVVNEIEGKGDSRQDKDTVTPSHPTDDQEPRSGERSGKRSGNSDSAVGQGYEETYTQGKYNIQSSTQIVRSKDKPSGGLSGKYNINVHPGSNVMVGDCGSMTIYAQANIDQKTLQLIKQTTGDPSGVQRKGGTGGKKDTPSS